MAKNGLLVPIAKAIAARRQERGPLASTAELAELVAGTVKTREPGQNPATRTFQALRIFVNAELEELAASARGQLEPAQRAAGRLVVISFHSLEDRIVKQFIAKHATRGGGPTVVPRSQRAQALEARWHSIVSSPQCRGSRRQPTCTQRHHAGGATHSPLTCCA